MEFDMTALFMRHVAPNKTQALRLILVDGYTAIVAADAAGLKLSALNSAKASFWRSFERLSRSFEVIYGRLQGEALYRFIISDGGDAWVFADYEISYVTDAMKGCLSESAFEQICSLYSLNEPLKSAAHAMLCRRESLVGAAEAHGVSKQMLSYTGNKIKHYASLLDAIVKTCKHYSNVRVYTLNKVDFTHQILGG